MRSEEADMVYTRRTTSPLLKTSFPAMPTQGKEKFSISGWEPFTTVAGAVNASSAVAVARQSSDTRSHPGDRIKFLSAKAPLGSDGFLLVEVPQNPVLHSSKDVAQASGWVVPEPIYITGTDFEASAGEWFYFGC